MLERHTKVSPIEETNGREALIRVSALTKRFLDVSVVGPVDLTVHKGEKICLVGPSGAGKTTFLRCLNLLAEPDGGSIHYKNELIGSWSHEAGAKASEKRLREYRSRIAMVFQHFELFPHLTALANVSLGPRHVLGIDRREADEKSLEILARVGLRMFAKKYPHELSGGQQQRVAIARALAMDPDMILFDEPTSALDPQLIGEVLIVMKELAQSGMTMVIVTHELRFARAAADRLVVMDKGCIVEEGPPREVMSNPKEPKTKEFLRSIFEI